MSKLFDDASLAMIPSAYKDGKLYSIRPTNGSGDFTFSRGSNLAATRVDVNGLIEKGYANQSHYSNNFTPSHWVKASANITANQQGYDGSSDAWLLTENSATSSHGLYDGAFVNGTGVQTHSMYLKGNGRDAQMRVFGIGSGQAYANFNLTSGTIGSSGGAILIDSNIESVGNGWYRCSMTLNPTAAQGIGVYLIPNDTHPEGGSYTGDSTSGLYVQDTQVNAGLVALPYVETESTTDAQAGILEDMPRLDYSGGATCPSLLLEPQRTNLVIQSEYFVSGGWVNQGVTIESNQATSPDGSQNATLLKSTTATSRHNIRINSDTSADSVLSVFAKQKELRYIQIGSGNTTYQYVNFDLADGSIGNIGSDFSNAKVEDYGNGWYRLSVVSDNQNNDFYISLVSSKTAGWLETWTPSSGDDGLYIFGAQHEAGSYPTSYIPTYGASVTRSQEDISLNITDFDLTSDSITCFQEVTIVDGREASSNWFWILGGGGSTGWKSLSTTSAGLFQLNGNGSFSDAIGRDYGSGTHKMCFKYENGVGTAFIDGVKYDDTSVDSAHPTMFTNIYIRGWYQRMMWKQLAVFPTALTDNECIALTTL